MKTNTITKLPKLAFGLGYGLLIAVVTLNSFKAEKKFAGTYYYTPATQQTWTAAGDAAPDQTSANYSLIGSQTYSCNNDNVACSYDLVDGEFIFNTKGKTSLVP